MHLSDVWRAIKAWFVRLWALRTVVSGTEPPLAPLHTTPPDADLFDENGNIKQHPIPKSELKNRAHWNKEGV